MKKIPYGILALGVWCLAPSCNRLVVKQTSPVCVLANTAVTNGGLQTELEMQGHLQGSYTGRFRWLSKTLKGNEHKYVTDNTSAMPMRGINAAKAAAMYNALEGSGSDILLAPIYQVQTKGRNITVTVSGTGARITDIKQIDTPVEEPQKRSIRPKGRGRLLGRWFGGARKQ